jgi:hypothetical protein
VKPTRTCGDCGAKPGEFHQPGCDVERCPYCGDQLISCGCLSDKKKSRWIHKNLMPWTGVWPGEEECIEFDLWCRWIPTPGFEENKAKFGTEEAFRRLGNRGIGHWGVCTKETPGARPDLNRLHVFSIWDRKKKRFVKAIGT